MRLLHVTLTVVVAVVAATTLTPRPAVNESTPLIPSDDRSTLVDILRGLGISYTCVASALDQCAAVPQERQVATLLRSSSPLLLPNRTQPAQATMTPEKEILLGLFRRPYEKREPPAVSEGLVVPSLQLARSIPRGTVFSTFLKSHRAAAKELCDYFMLSRNAKDLQQMAESVRNELNEKLFIYAVTYTIIRKPEMSKIPPPSIVEVFPTSFVPRATLGAMEKQVRQSSALRQDYIITEYGPEFSSTHQKPEHRVAYWREDYGINLHHWHWHLVNPVGDEDVQRDRKGELFYYMHQQMVARYDMDRLSVGLNRVEKLGNWRIPIPDGYFSKLTLDNAGQIWGSRQDDTSILEYRREEFNDDAFDISDLEQQHYRIMAAIHQGSLLDREGNRVTLTDEGVPPSRRGIVLLGDAIEADSRLSINYPFYGDLHNLGHNIISAVHDPDSSHKENLGVMSDTATAARDPVFWRWHKYIDALFQEYKLMQKPYTTEQLSLQSVTVSKVEVECDGSKNVLTTGWKTRDYEASHGLDFQSDVPVIVRLTHLDHHPFKYNIEVENKETEPKEVTIRIFMAPKLNERGIEMNYMEQRLLWAEMDRFKHTLIPGSHTVHRESTESSITNPNDFTFRDIENLTVTDNPEAREDNFRQCGWPQHMLLPRGKQEGMDFQLLVMVTDWAQDKVEQPAERRNAPSFCGIQDSLYPDARPMGFPFDRRPGNGFNSSGDNPMQKTEELATLSNVAMQDIQIVFKNGPLEQ